MNAHAMTYMQPVSHSEYGPQAASPAKAPGTTKIESLLTARLRKGDERAFNELVAQNHGALIRMAMRYVADQDAAEEVAQDTWIAVIDGIHRFEGRSSLRTWIFSILIHKAKDRGVRERKHVTFSDLESCDDSAAEAVDPSRFHVSGELAGHWALPPQPWDEQTPERLLASKQALEALSEAVDKLPPGLRAVLMLKDVEELESAEICERLKITETNLYVRLHRARERVRNAVETALRGRCNQDVRSGGFTALTPTVPAIARKPCQNGKNPVQSPVRR